MMVLSPLQKEFICIQVFSNSLVIIGQSHHYVFRFWYSSLIYRWNYCVFVQMLEILNYWKKGKKCFCARYQFSYSGNRTVRMKKELMILITKWFWDKWQGMLLTQYMLLVFQTFCSVCNTYKLQTQHLVAFATFLCCKRDIMLRMRHLRVPYATTCCVCDICVLRMQQIFTKREFSQNRLLEIFFNV